MLSTVALRLSVQVVALIKIFHWFSFLVEFVPNDPVCRSMDEVMSVNPAVS